MAGVHSGRFCGGATCCSRVRWSPMCKVGGGCIVRLPSPLSRVGECVGEADSRQTTEWAGVTTYSAPLCRWLCASLPRWAIFRAAAGGAAGTGA